MVSTRSSSQCPEKTSLHHLKSKPICHPIVQSSSKNLKPLIEEANYFTASIQMLSSYKVIDEIKNKLTPRQVGLFEKTCFGQFLKLSPLQFSAQLVHNILLRQLVCPEKENSLVFRICSKECEFGLQDFALITGLNCSEYISPRILDREGKLSNRIRDEYYNGSDRVYDEDIAQVFREYRGNRDDDAVKLAQLYLLESVLLSKPRKVACHNFFVRLVDNADEFDKFPWGRYVYEFTVESMKHALEVKVEKLGSKRKKYESTGFYEQTYFLRGFPHVLQFWAIECIPLIREKFGQRNNGNTPRMLNWAPVAHPKVVDWKYEVFGGDEFQVENGLQPVEKELREDYFRYFLVKQTVTKDNEKSEIGGEIHMNEEGGDNVGTKYDDITQRKARKECGDGQNSKPQTLRNMIRAETSPAFCELRYEIIPILTKQRSNVAETDFDIASIEVDEDDNQDNYTPQRKHKRYNVQGADEIPCFTVDLFELPNHDEKTEFGEWIKVGLSKHSKRHKYFDVCNELHPGFDFTILTCTKKDWFLWLDRAAQWLNSSHIDVALYFIRKKKKNHPDVFKHSCTTTDSLFYSKLNTRYLKFKQDPENFLWHKELLIQKTVEGLEPQSSLPWVDVDTVYIPVNVNKKHWVVAALDLKECRLNVYDSYHAVKHDKEVLSACQTIADMVPWLLKSLGFFDERNDIHIARDVTAPFDVKLVQDVPQQENEGDSAMFMLKFTEFLMQDVPLEKCNQEAISFFRNKMAVELYAYGKKRMAKK